MSNHDYVTANKPALPQLVNTRRAAQILGRSAATLKRWRCEGIGPNWIEMGRELELIHEFANLGAGELVTNTSLANSRLNISHAWRRKVC